MKDTFVINGGYMETRASYFADGTVALCIDVEFEPAKLSFKDFRAKVAC